MCWYWGLKDIFKFLILFILIIWNVNFFDGFYAGAKVLFIALEEKLCQVWKEKMVKLLNDIHTCIIFAGSTFRLQVHTSGIQSCTVSLEHMGHILDQSLFCPDCTGLQYCFQPNPVPSISNLFCRLVPWTVKCCNLVFSCI